MSRATDHKYMLRPEEIVEFKHFFTPKVGVNTGEGESARIVQAQLRKMIELDLPSRPVGDNFLSKMLADKGLSIARRSVSN